MKESTKIIVMTLIVAVAICSMVGVMVWGIQPNPSTVQTVTISKFYYAQDYGNMMIVTNSAGRTWSFQLNCNGIYNLTQTIQIEQRNLPQVSYVGWIILNEPTGCS